MQIGQYNTFTVEKYEPQGAYLIDEIADRVLLPNAYLPEDLRVGESITVFVYNDSEDRPVATNIEPKLTLGEIAVLEITSITQFGAFADWGLPKDLFIPFRQQNKKLQLGDRVPVYLYCDEKTNRLVGTTKVEKHLNQETIPFAEGDEADMIVFEQTDLGYKVLIGKKHLGLAYQNEIFQTIKIGDAIKGRIKHIRPDGKIDVLLQQSGYSAIDANTEAVLNALKANKGFLALNDKSSPEMIKSILSMSKKSFKMAVGNLYKNKVISFESDGIRLIQG